MKKAKVTDNGNIKLTMTQEQASVLRSLIGNHIGGSGKHRDMMDELYYALEPITEPYFLNISTTGNKSLYLK